MQLLKTLNTFCSAEIFCALVMASHLQSFLLRTKSRKVGMVRKTGWQNAATSVLTHRVFKGSVLSDTWIHHQAALLLRVLHAQRHTFIKMQNSFICMRWKEEQRTNPDQSKTHHGQNAAWAATHPRLTACLSTNLLMDEYEKVRRIDRWTMER